MTKYTIGEIRKISDAEIASRIETGESRGHAGKGVHYLYIPVGDEQYPDIAEFYAEYQLKGEYPADYEWAGDEEIEDAEEYLLDSFKGWLASIAE